ncbi:unnamed protein product [Haemonchus placei]|uniref:Vegetative cell wall protein gp1-like n=1 Tax=Haemonchus placei TaxID=6290 RepID=A0A0N4VX31_HAEPC|nr:unnamed protein product [Haemonchus placei]
MSPFQQSQTKRRSAGPAPGAVPIMPGIAQPVTPKERPQPREELPASPPPAPVSVLPPIGQGASHTPSVPPASYVNATLACELRRPPSSDEEENNDAEWEEEDVGPKAESHARPSAAPPSTPSVPVAEEVSVDCKSLFRNMIARSRFLSLWQDRRSDF